MVLFLKRDLGHDNPFILLGGFKLGGKSAVFLFFFQKMLELIIQLDHLSTDNYHMPNIEESKQNKRKFHLFSPFRASVAYEPSIKQTIKNV